MSSFKWQIFEDDMELKMRQRLAQSDVKVWYVSSAENFAEDGH